MPSRRYGSYLASTSPPRASRRVLSFGAYASTLFRAASLVTGAPSSVSSRNTRQTCYPPPLRHKNLSLIARPTPCPPTLSTVLSRAPLHTTTCFPCDTAPCPLLRVSCVPITSQPILPISEQIDPHEGNMVVTNSTDAFVGECTDVEGSHHPLARPCGVHPLLLRHPPRRSLSLPSLSSRPLFPVFPFDPSEVLSNVQPSGALQPPPACRASASTLLALVSTFVACPNLSSPQTAGAPFSTAMNWVSYRRPYGRGDTVRLSVHSHHRALTVRSSTPPHLLCCDLVCPRWTRQVEFDPDQRAAKAGEGVRVV